MSQVRTFDWVPEEKLKNSEKKNRTSAYFADGEASFCIEGVEDGFSANGNPKTMFKLSIIDTNGRTGQYTVHVAKSLAWQFMNIFNAIGTGIYRQGGFCDDDVLNKNGKLIFGSENSPERGWQNKVVKWLPYDGQAQPNKLTAGLPKAEENFDDDIPF